MFSWILYVQQVYPHFLLTYCNIYHQVLYKSMEQYIYLGETMDIWSQMRYILQNFKISTITTCRWISTKFQWYIIPYFSTFMTLFFLYSNFKHYKIDTNNNILNKQVSKRQYLGISDQKNIIFNEFSRLYPPIQHIKQTKII